MLIPDRLWNQMSNEEQELVRETVRGNRVRSRTIECPHCRGQIQVCVKADVTAVEVPSEKTFKPGVVLTQKNALPSPYRELVEAARASGLLEHFEAAVREHMVNGAPSDIEPFFCRFWKLVAPVHLTARQRDLVWTHYGSGAEAWGANGVYVIVRSGLVQGFVPQRFLKSSVSAGQYQISIEPQFETWVRGRWGYVPVEARGFSEALKQTNIGKFGVLVQ